MEDDALPRVQVFRVSPDGEAPVWLGYGTAFAPRAVILHPGPARSARAAMQQEGVAADTGMRVHCRVEAPGDPVIDGHLEASAQGRWGHLVIADLDLSIEGVDAGEVGSGSPLRQDDYAEALEALIRQRETTDPPPPDQPPPSPHGGSPSVDNPGISPPWCWLFPHAPGCG